MASYLVAVRRKWRALQMVVQMKGFKTGNLWMQKRPIKYVKQAEEACRVKTNLLEENPECFAGLRHPAGCSLQYLSMLSEILGGTWHKDYMNPYAEYVPENNDLSMGNTLRKIMRKARNVRN